MKGFLYFLGTLLQWPVKKTNQFLLLHAYWLLIYGLAYFVSSTANAGYGLILVLGALGPLFLVISKGLPLNCLDYKAAIDRE